MNTKIFSVTEDITDGRLKDGWCIDKNKGHYKLLIMAIRSVECHLPLTPPLGAFSRLKWVCPGFMDSIRGTRVVVLNSMMEMWIAYGKVKLSLLKAAFDTEWSHPL